MRGKKEKSVFVSLKSVFITIAGDSDIFVSLKFQSNSFSNVTKKTVKYITLLQHKIFIVNIRNIQLDVQDVDVKP